MVSAATADLAEGEVSFLTLPADLAEGGVSVGLTRAVPRSCALLPESESALGFTIWPSGDLEPGFKVDLFTVVDVASRSGLPAPIESTEG